MINKIPTALLHLPNEVLHQILSYLPVQDLYRNVDMTCRRLKDATYYVYQRKYGRGPAPVSDVVDKWKLFAIRNEEFLKHTDAARDQEIDYFLQIYIDSPGDYLMEYTEDIIYYLHENPKKHHRGLEAIIAALNTQQRPEEYQRILGKYAELLTPEGKALLQARFGLEFHVSWNNHSVDVLNQCLLAAVTTDDMDLFITLKELIIAKHGDLDYLGASLAASRSGVSEMLRYLLKSFNINSNARHLDDLLDTAVKYDRAYITKLLLDTGLFINLDHHYELALRCGYIDVLHQFQQHSPDIAGTYFSNGELQVACVLKNGRNRKETINFLIKSASTDINAVGRDGLTAVQFAADNGLVKEFEFLNMFGADLSACGFIQQTAAEIAYCNQHALPINSALPVDILSLKQNLSKMVLKKFKNQRVRHLVVTHNKNPSDCESAYEYAEDELAAVWTRKIGLQTLQQLQHILETSLYTSVVRVYGWLMHFDKYLQFNSQSRGVGSNQTSPIRVTTEGFLDRSLQERHLACCGSDVLTEEDTTNFSSFIETGAGRALILRQVSFFLDEHGIWSRLEQRVKRIQGCSD